MNRVAPFALLASLFLLTAEAEPLPRFPPNAVWNRPVTAAAVHPDSAAMLAALSGLGGWGNGNRFQIDFSMQVLQAAADAPTRPVIAGPNGYYQPDCANPGLAFPLPPGGAIEGAAGYQCDVANADCHLLVVQGRKLYESYNSNVTGAGVQSACAVVWDLDKVYPAQGRGEQCTSTDAAGFPIAPLLINADEVALALNDPDGDLGHAIRFILPNARMAAGVYVHPASHAGAPSGPVATVPYGARLRLKTGFDMRNYPPAAKVILRTMQRYGIVLSDGGNIALTAQDDRYTSAKWAALEITSRVFVDRAPAVGVADFEVIQTGPRIASTWNCARVRDDFLFIDRFDY